MSRRTVAGLLVVLGLWGCGGGGGGGGGGGLEGGPASWAVPFTATSSSQRLHVTFHNLTSSTATAGVTEYAYDGTPGGGGPVTLDGFDSETITFVGTPTIAWLFVSTPSETVEVSFAHTDLTGPVDEASRAFPIDVGPPPPATTQVVPIVLDATSLRVTNTTGVGVVVTATPYPTPAPGADAVAGAPVNVPLNAFQTTLLDPDTFGAGFLGQVVLSAATPFFAAIVEGTSDLAFDGVPPVRRRDRILDVGVAWGLDHAVPAGYTDFALVLSNTSADPREVDLTDVRRTDGTAILFAPRAISLGAHETVTVSSFEPPFADLFGDAMLAVMLVKARLELFVPEEVDVSVRQFDPVFLLHVATQRPMPTGHVVDVMGVQTQSILPTGVRQWVAVHNPTPVPLTVTASVVIPQPDGFDAGAVPLATLTVPAWGFVEVSPDASAYVDRDGVPVDFVALRFTGPTAFAITARRETRAVNGLLLRLSPMIVRSHDDAN